MSPPSSVKRTMRKFFLSRKLWYCGHGEDDAEELRVYLQIYDPVNSVVGTMTGIIQDQLKDEWERPN